jgi:hypothetical protein
MEALCNNQNQLSPWKSSFNHEAAKVAVTKYIDYFGGKAIKMDLSGDEVDPRIYDRDAGEGAFARVVATLR